MRCTTPTRSSAPFSRDPRLAEIAADLGMARPLLLQQSMVIFKHAQTGGEVVPHQDCAYL